MSSLRKIAGAWVLNSPADCWQRRTSWNGIVAAVRLSRVNNIFEATIQPDAHLFVEDQEAPVSLLVRTVEEGKRRADAALVAEGWELEDLKPLGTGTPTADELVVVLLAHPELTIGVLERFHKLSRDGWLKIAGPWVHRTDPPDRRAQVHTHWMRKDAYGRTIVKVWLCLDGYSLVITARVGSNRTLGPYEREEEAKQAADDVFRDLGWTLLDSY